MDMDRAPSVRLDAVCWRASPRRRIETASATTRLGRLNSNYNIRAYIVKSRRLASSAICWTSLPSS